jgi:hypothetical protein
MFFSVKPVAAILPMAVVFSLAGATGIAATPGAPLPDETPFVQQFEGRLTVGADHVATEVYTRKITVLTQAAIASVSEQQMTFIEGIETLDILEAYTAKADGRRIPVPAQNILTQDAASDLPGTYFRDEKQRTVIFSDVGVGDTLVMTNKRVTAWGKALDDFTERLVFARSAAYSSVKVTVEAPASLGLHVNATGNSIVNVTEDQAGIRRHAISITPESYAPDESGAVSVLDRDPAVLVSTYGSYREIGESYGRNALPKVKVTPEIAALADEITAGTTDRRAQAAAIDAWMKKNVRYVAVYLSFDRIIPNDAATVLKNRFGDCKDKATLMVALLAAKGIAADEVLVDLGRSYSLPEPPVTEAFNHVIVYLPEFDLYDDPTANLAAFGVMSFETYDKPVVRVSADSAKLAHTPAMKPGDHTSYAKTTFNVAADGTASGETVESNTGALASVLRSDGAYVQSLGSAVAARRLLQRGSTPGTGQFDLSHFTGTADPVAITGSFALAERFKVPGVDENAVIPDGMLFNASPGNLLLGPRFSGRKSAFVCYAGRQTEDIEATFARPFPLPLPPRPVAIDNPAFTYRSTATIDGRTLRIHRQFVSRVERQVCPPGLEATIAADLETVRENVSYRLTFMTENPSGMANSPIGVAARAVPAPQSEAMNAAVLAAVGLPPAVQNSAAADPSHPLDLAKVVAAGHRLRVEFLYAIEPDCSSMGETVVRILEPPLHGNVTIENGQGFTSFARQNQRYDCNMRRSDGTFVFYDPEAGFAGRDSMTLDVIFPTGQASRQRYAIEVR